MDIISLLTSQKKYFETGATLPTEFRIKMLKKLYNSIKNNEKEICNALTLDLGKSDFEGFMCEIGLVLSEISYMLKHIKKYSGKKPVHTPLAQFPSKSYTLSVPYGNVLIMSPWNYPFLLTIDPLVNAIAAGNTAIIKPSAYSENTSNLVKKLIEETFDSDYIAVITGSRKENAELLNQKFDLVFFTGSQAVGKEVLRHTAETLTPAILELGGKSPCIVDSSANIPLAAKRIVFGKFLNCGQTCVAPDYILCKSSVKDALLKELKKEIKIQFGENPLKNPHYGKIINQKHFERLLELIDPSKVVIGGNSNPNSLQIAPTVMDSITYDDKVMGEEIFGPILPILTFEDTKDVISKINMGQKPLALYLFSNSKSQIEQITKMVSFGGGCINDTIIHLATSEMGFGGVGESGMGAYHGKIGFDAFSHTKSIVDKKCWLDLPFRYQPYEKFNLKLLKIFLK